MSALCVYNQFPNLWHLTGRQEIVKDVRATLDRFGIGVSPGEFTERLNREGELMLSAYGYDFWFFAFEVNGGYLEPCFLEYTERTQTSRRYHKRKAHFGEYMFPAEFDWAGVAIRIVKSGEEVKRPEIKFRQKDGWAVIEIPEWELVAEAGRTEIGAWVSVPKENLDFMPRRRYNQ